MTFRDTDGSGAGAGDAAWRFCRGGTRADRRRAGGGLRADGLWRQQCVEQRRLPQGHDAQRHLERHAGVRLAGRAVEHLCVQRGRHPLPGVGEAGPAEGERPEGLQPLLGRQPGLRGHDQLRSDHVRERGGAARGDALATGPPPGEGRHHRRAGQEAEKRGRFAVSLRPGAAVRGHQGSGEGAQGRAPGGRGRGKRVGKIHQHDADGSGPCL